MQKDPQRDLSLENYPLRKLGSRIPSEAHWDGREKPQLPEAIMGVGSEILVGMWII